LLVPAFAVFLSAFAKPEYSYSIPVLTEQDKTVADDSVAVTPSDTRVKDLSNKVQKNVPFWINGKDKPSDVAFYVDGKEVTSIDDLNPHDIHSLSVMKDKTAMELYGKENAILIITKKHARETGLEDSATPAGETKDINDKPSNRKIKSISMDGNNVLVDFDGDDGKKMLIVIDGKENSGTIKSSETNEIKYTVNGKYTTCEDKSMSYQLSSINEQKPLIIVDGEEYTGNIKDMDVNDIKSFSILKDSAATTHYGEKGEYGVIIITTKAAQLTKPKNATPDGSGKQRPVH
jgi:TonB-dependent SusC/RagA subfamily outer membrane receptor